MKQFVHDIKSYRPGDQTAIDAACNDIAFYNGGASSVTLNGLVINAGQTVELNGQADEMNVSKFQITFSSTAATEVLYVLRKIYK